MGSFCDSESMLFELVHRVLHDNPPYPLALVYLYGQSPDNEFSVLNQGGELVKSKDVNQVAVSGLEKGYGYNGGDDWQEKLQRMGVNIIKIFKIPPVKSIFPPCTDSEADALIAFMAKAFAAPGPTFGICASPLHQTRAFVSTVSAMRRAEKFFRIFNVVGKPVNWGAEIVHSQGIERGVRKSLVRAELGKLNDYCGKTTFAGKSTKLPPLLSAEEILAYLDERDKDVV